MKITTVLFDLDGTLTDSGPGIMKKKQQRWLLFIENISQ